SSSMTFVMGLLAASQIATAINASFVIGKFIIPPMKRAMERAATYFGYHIQELYYKKQSLNLEDDQFIIRALA
ncbi:MAG: hypothetical protein Q8K40_02970, partial [Ignavibacteria bacterium]|nr:hypothetical protein [Ignavibacteria bacterium]